MYKIAFASSILAAFYSPVNSLRLTGTPDASFGTGPILTEDDSLNLGYHGRGNQNWWETDFGEHSFWVYPQDSRDFS